MNEDSIRRGEPEFVVQSADKLIKALKSGKTLQEAADDVGQPLETLLTKEVVKRKLEALANVLPIVDDPEVLRRMTLASMTEILLTGEHKDRIGAAKVIAQAPELNLGGGNQGPAVSIILSEETKSLKIDPLWWDKSDDPPK